MTSEEGIKTHSDFQPPELWMSILYLLFHLEWFLLNAIRRVWNGIKYNLSVSSLSNLKNIKSDGKWITVKVSCINRKIIYNYFLKLLQKTTQIYPKPSVNVQNSFSKEFYLNSNNIKGFKNFIMYVFSF